MITLVQLFCFAEFNLSFVNNLDFEIYVSKESISYKARSEYDKINLDIIELASYLFLTIDDIESYNAANQTINLKKSKYSLDFFHLVFMVKRLWL